jgi:uncharacterized membrane protein YedE/YeeE
MLETSWIYAALGGAVIGLAASLHLLARGEQVGISGMVSDVVRNAGGRLQDAHLFLLGLAIAGLVGSLLVPSTSAIVPIASAPVLAVAGLLVGFGTRLSGGCTSGHGVSGISRFSVRSVVATLTFIAFGALVTLARHALGSA